MHARQPCREDPQAPEHERGRRGREREQHALRPAYETRFHLPACIDLARSRLVHGGVTHGVVPPFAVVVVVLIADLRTDCTRYAVMSQSLPVWANVNSM